MALNPELIQGNDYLFPSNQGSEFTFLRRGDVTLKLFLPNRTIKEDGMVFLTSTRLVFVKSPKSKTNVEFKAVEMPLNLIENPKFEQPIFGTNYLCGFVNPIVNSPNSLRSKCKWHLCFSKGGSSTSFLTCFGRVYEESKRGVPLQPFGQNNEPFFSSTNAYMDPSDPTYLYISETPSQPVYQPQNAPYQHYSPMPDYPVNGPNQYQPNQPNQYQPNQYQPNQYQPNQYQPNQYQPNQYQPNQYQPNQTNPPNQYQPNQINPPNQYQPNQINPPNQYQPNQINPPNQYQPNHCQPNQINQPNQYQPNQINAPAPYQQNQTNQPSQYQSVVYEPNQYQFTHYQPTNMNTANSSAPFIDSIRNDLSPQLNEHLLNQRRAAGAPNPVNTRPNNPL